MNCFLCDLRKDVRVSQKGTEYSVTEIVVKCPHCDVSMLIEDFKVSIPFEVNNLQIHINKDNNGRYVINELNYTIGWVYSMGIALLLTHNH